MILSHAPGRLVNVTSRVSVSSLLHEGVKLPGAQMLNLFNVSLVEDTGERLDPGSGAIVCVGVRDGSLCPLPHPTLPRAARTHCPPPHLPLLLSMGCPACTLTCATPAAPRRVQRSLPAPLAVAGAAAASGRVGRAFPLPRERALLAARRDR